MIKIYTIGYSTFQIEAFIEILKKYGINSLIDVRSNPQSKFYEDYNKETLSERLKQSGIIYRSYREEFGARQDDKQYFTNGYLDFNKFAKSKKFLEGINKIEAGIEKNYIFAFMCAEKDPSTCHRNIMVAREFYKKGYDVGNILSDGSLESQESIESRLIETYFPNRNQFNFFGEELTEQDMVARSYALRNSEIGFRIDDEDDEDE